MSTRGLIGWKNDGEYHGQYNHSDSYPSWLGKEAIALVRHFNIKGWEMLRQNLRLLTVINGQDTAPADLAEKYEKYNGDLSGHAKTEWYNLLRELQGTGYLKEIGTGNLAHVPDNIDFIKDSLFCEYAYILNLDNMTLDCYRGFQEQPQSNNPFGTEPEQSGSGTDYYPCAYCGSINFDFIKADDVDNNDLAAYRIMLKMFSKAEGEED
jgi:hypothetical protein